MKQLYRLRRRYQDWPAGAEVQLTADEAQRIDNEAPGAIEGPLGPAAPPKAAPKVKPEPEEDA